MIPSCPRTAFAAGASFFRIGMRKRRAVSFWNLSSFKKRASFPSLRTSWVSAVRLAVGQRLIKG